MKVHRKYICSKCYEEFLSIEDITNHMKNSHPEIEDLDAYIDIIDLDSREWTDFEQRRIRPEPIKTEPSVPREYLPEGWVRAEEYPEKPYYYYDGQYWCSEHKFLTKSESEFLAHVLAHHTNDFDKVLRHVVKQGLLKKVTSDMTKKELETLVYQEIKDWLSKVEEKEPIALQKHVESYFEDLLSYLEGTTDICPICNKVATIDNKHHLDKIMFCLLKGAKEYEHLRKKLEAYKGKEANWLLNESYPCQWNGRGIGMRLTSVLHLYQDHRTTFERLVKSSILSGELIDFLQNKKYLSKETQPPMLKADEKREQLSRGITIKKKVNLSKAEQALLDWLNKGTTASNE
jgi:hypothetical protein